MSELFPAEFLAALDSLRIEARRVPPGGRHGEHHAREAGAGIEFRDYRAYSPGDDFRRIDWNLYQRFRRVYLRLLDELRDLPLYVLLDLSDSMWLEDPPRADAARRAAALMAAVSLGQLDRVAIHPFGAVLGAPLPPTSGKRHLPRVLAFLQDLGRQGRTDFARSLGDFARLPHRRGLVVVISDFFDEGGLDAVTGAMGVLRHRLLLVRVVNSRDRNPPESGELRLVDCESGATVDVTVSERVRNRYLEQLEAFDAGLARFAAGRNAELVEVDAEEPVLPRFHAVFRGGVFRP
jgi:uncharacterized protein (DUF58 family)